MSWASRYETIASIGTGGMAEVFVGRIRGADGRLVALKRAHSHVRSDSKVVESMVREANLAARVRHPNVVGVLGVDEIDGDLVLVLEYVEGCTLRLISDRLQTVREQRPREMIRILLDVAAGLHAAHLTGLIHRDVSPSNMLVGSDGVARLADFGIAKAELENRAASEQTATGILKGKLAYMAPEYILSQRINPASDLFSLAVAGWESLAGKRLFYGASELETLANIAEGNVRPLSCERPELAPLDMVFERALSRLPEDRHSSVEEMAIELEHVARGYDLVASHAEVARLVERAAEPELIERRRVLRADVETIVGAIHLPIDPPTQIHIPAQTSRTSRAAPTARRAPQTSRSSRPPRPSPPLSSRPPVSSPPAHRSERAEVEARREKLALVGALMLLALALGWMWTQLRNDAPIPIHARPQSLSDAATSATMDAAVTPPTSGSSQRSKRPRRPAQ